MSQQAKEYVVICGKDEETMQKAGSSMLRHARCGKEYAKAYKRACLGMRPEENLAE